MSQQPSDDVNERITDRGDPQETSERHGRSGSESPAPFSPHWIEMVARRGWQAWTIRAPNYPEPAAIIQSCSGDYYLSYPTEDMSQTFRAIEDCTRQAYTSLDAALVALRLLHPNVRVCE